MKTTIRVDDNEVVIVKGNTIYNFYGIADIYAVKALVERLIEKAP